MLRNVYREPIGIMGTSHLVYYIETSERPISTNRKHKINSVTRDLKRAHFARIWAELRKPNRPLSGFCTVEIWSSFFQDVDAPLKFILDTMKGTLIVDDKQIVKVTVSRVLRNYESIGIKLTHVGSIRDIMKLRLEQEPL